jgi:hypothetical protein
VGLLIAYVVSTSLSYTLDTLVNKASNHIAFCSAAGELASKLSQDGSIHLNTEWESGDTFLTIEKYQLEKKLISIAACTNEGLLREIVSSPGYKKKIKDAAYSMSKIESSMQNYKHFVANYNKMYSGYVRLHKTPHYNRGYRKFHAELVKAQGFLSHKRSTALMKIMGFQEANCYSNCTGSIITKKALFEQIMIKHYGMFVEYGTTAKNLEKSLFTIPFEQKYSELLADIDFSTISEYRNFISDEYKPVVKINIVMTLAILTILWSLSSILSTVLILVPPMDRLKYSKYFINPLVIMFIFIYLLPKPVSLGYYDDTLFKGGYKQSILYHVLKIHYTTYPILKNYYSEINNPAWLDTYWYKSEKKYIKIYKDRLKSAMNHYNYTTPIQKSAIINLEKLNNLGALGAVEIGYFNQIYNYYKNKKGNEEKLLYMDKLKKRFNIIS